MYAMYSFFRKNKARRAYEHALRLRGMGFDTPEPVAWSEYRKDGLIADTYFVSRRSELTPLPQTMRRFPAPDTLPVLEVQNLTVVYRLFPETGRRIEAVTAERAAVRVDAEVLARIDTPEGTVACESRSRFVAKRRPATE